MSNELQQYTKDDVRILSRETKHRGFFKVEGIKLQFRKFDGSWSEEIYRELVSRDKAVGLLPYDPKLKKVILIEQFRIGALEDKQSPWALELIAGLIENGEPTESVIKRESVEEAGLVVSDIAPIMDYWTSLGGSNGHMSLFYTEVDASNVGGIHGLDEEHEDIRVHAIDSQQVFEWLEQDKLNNAPIIIALQWLKIKLAP